MSQIIGYDATGVYTLRRVIQRKNGFTSQSDIILEHYDKGLSLTKSLEIQLKGPKKKRNYEYATQLGGEIYLFSSSQDMSSKQMILFVQKIDKKTLQLKGEKRIAQVSSLKKDLFKRGSFQITISKNSSKVLILGNPTFEKDKNEKFTLSVFD
ncbi:MAG: hypothetical protein AAFY71_22695, partial [Bacteroidota bacterium]